MINRNYWLSFVTWFVVDFFESCQGKIQNFSLALQRDGEKGIRPFFPIHFVALSCVLISIIFNNNEAK